MTVLTVRSQGKRLPIMFLEFHCCAVCASSTEDLNRQTIADTYLLLEMKVQGSVNSGNEWSWGEKS